MSSWDSSLRASNDQERQRFDRTGSCSHGYRYLDGCRECDTLRVRWYKLKRELDKLVKNLIYNSDTCGSDIAGILNIALSLGIIKAFTNTTSVLTPALQSISQSTTPGRDMMPSQSSQAGRNYETIFQINNEFSREELVITPVPDFSSDVRADDPMDFFDSFLEV
jgi:hypothetical protein